MSNEVQFTKVSVGNLGEIPPDLAPGEWEGVLAVKKAATANGGYPMLILEWKATEALTDGNEDFVGKKVADFLVFFPTGHAGEKMGKLKLKAICEQYEIAIPAVEEIETWDDIADFIGELEGMKGKFWTFLKQNKETGEMQTQVSYNPPKGGGLSRAVDDAPAGKGKNGKAPAKKASRRN